MGDCSPRNVACRPRRRTRVLDPDETVQRLAHGPRRWAEPRARPAQLPVASRRSRSRSLALDALPRRAWLRRSGPALALCAVVAIPGVIDPHDLDARPVNAIPAVGVVLAFGLTVAAARRAGASFAAAPPGDPVRMRRGDRARRLSLPWITAALGFHFPAGVFLTERAVRRARRGRRDGGSPPRPPSRPRRAPPRPVGAAPLASAPHGRLASPCVLRPRVASMVAYGAANLAQDFWHEQVVKRGWTSWDDPVGPRSRASTSSWALIVVATVAALCARVRAAAPRRPQPAIITRDDRSRAWCSSGSASTPARTRSTRWSRSSATSAGGGRRTRVWIEGSSSRSSPRGPSGRSSTTWGTRPATPRCSTARSTSPSGSPPPRRRVVSTSGDLGRRARRLLAATARPDENEQLF